MLRNVIASEELNADNYSVQEKEVFTELLDSLPEYIDAYGLDNGVNAHLRVLQNFYSNVLGEPQKDLNPAEKLGIVFSGGSTPRTKPKMTLDEFKESNEYTDFINIQVTANAIQRVQTVDDQTNEAAYYAEQFKRQQMQPQVK